jgi:hypothetical protein
MSNTKPPAASSVTASGRKASARTARDTTTSAVPRSPWLAASSARARIVRSDGSGTCRPASARKLTGRRRDDQRDACIRSGAGDDHAREPGASAYVDEMPSVWNLRSHGQGVRDVAIDQRLEIAVAGQMEPRVPDLQQIEVALQARQRCPIETVEAGQTRGLHDSRLGVIHWRRPAPTTGCRSGPWERSRGVGTGPRHRSAW